MSNLPIPPALSEEEWKVELDRGLKVDDEVRWAGVTGCLDRSVSDFHGARLIGDLSDDADIYRDDD